MSAAAEVIAKTYGLNLQDQGKGLYISMEFLAILRGSLLLECDEGSEHRLLPAPEKATQFWRPSHDFARRIIHGLFTPDTPHEKLDEQSRLALKDLLAGLELPRAKHTKEPGNWRGRHLYPFPSEFIGWDSLQRGPTKIELHGNSYRGAGSLVHRILRNDPNFERLQKTRAGLRELLADSDTKLGRLADALHELDATREAARKAHESRREETADQDTATSPWREQLRDGVSRIVTRSEVGVPKSKKIEALVYWIPYCIVRHMHSLAITKIGGGTGEKLFPWVVDFLPENSRLRDQSRRDFAVAWTAVRDALIVAAKEQEEHELAQQNHWLKSPRGFWSGTAFAVGALNAGRGTRWFRLGPELMDAIVLAKVEDRVKFGEFCHDILYKTLGIMVDVRSARAHGIRNIDQSTFHGNEESLAGMLSDLGNLERYSDTTRMVGVPH